MKVLFLTSMYYKPGGTYAGTAIHRQAVELRRAGIEVRVICPVPRFHRGDTAGRGSQAGSTGNLVIDGVPVRYFSFPNTPLGWSPGLYCLILRRFLTRAVRDLDGQFKYDLIHAHRLFPTGYVALSIARERGVPLVVSAVGSDVHTHPGSHPGVRRRTSSAVMGAAAVLSVSESLADQVRGLSPSGPSVRVAYRGVDTEMFGPAPNPRELRARLGLPLDGIGICTAGRLVREKGVFELFSAFEELASRLPGLWLAMVGDGPLHSELTRRARVAGLDDRVFLPGSCNHDDVPGWMNAADIFVLASYDEGLPNVVREAMACARAVVATDVGGTAEALDHEVAGLLVPARAVGPLSAAIGRLAESQELRVRMGIEGRRIVSERFTWGASTDRVRTLYEEVLGAEPIGSRRDRCQTSRER